MTTVAQLAHRGLRRRLSAYHDSRDEAALVAQWDDVDAPAIGIYLNPPDVGTGTVVITDRALLFSDGEGRVRLPFSAIAEVHGPHPGVGSRAIEIRLLDGSQVSITIAGRQDQFQDVYPFLHFVSRAVSLSTRQAR
jgi:hypothetical protein